MAMGPRLLSALIAIDGLDSVLDRVRETVRQTPWAGWIALLIGIAAGLTLGKLAGALLGKFGAKLETRGWRARALLLTGSAGPLLLAIFTLGLSVGLAWIALSPSLRDFVGRVISLLYIFSLAWLLYNAVGLVDVALHRWTSRKTSRLDEGIVPLVRKTLRIFLAVVFVLFTAQNVLGADIGAWLAGLGIAGLAVSLAAQDSIRNVFGSLMIFLDRPFTVGDQIQFDKWEGLVEEIGFRSTKLRTTGGELVTIPNSNLAGSAVVNIDKRPHIRRVITLTLEKNTPIEKIEQTLQILREIVADPDLSAAFDTERFPPRVVFEDLAGGSPVIKVYYWFTPPDAWGYAEHAQRMNLRITRGLAAAEIKLA
jgi:MscS family membrane protein